jgi:hypothetical protein
MVKYEENSGKSMESAIRILDVSNSMEGIQAEYAYLSKMFGERGKDWDLVMQALMEEGGKSYDMMTVKLSDGAEKIVYFDITEFYGK